MFVQLFSLLGRGVQNLIFLEYWSRFFCVTHVKLIIGTELVEVDGMQIFSFFHAISVLVGPALLVAGVYVGDTFGCLVASINYLHVFFDVAHRCEDTRINI